MAVTDEISSYCRMSAREHDIDAYLAALFVPEPVRGDLWALQAFAAEITRIPRLVSEPMLGEIRLQWWREALARLFEGRTDPHPVMQALAAMRMATDRPLLEGLIDSHALMLAETPIENEADLNLFVTGAARGLLALQAGAIAPDLKDDSRLGEALNGAGHVLGSAALLAEHRRRAAMGGAVFSSALFGARAALIAQACDAHAAARRAFASLGDKRVLPIFLPAGLAAARLRTIERNAPDEPPVFLRQLRFLCAMLRGNI